MPVAAVVATRLRIDMQGHAGWSKVSDGAKELMVEKGYDPAMGARPLRRAIQRYIEDPLADFVLRSELKPGATVLVEPGTEEGDEDVKLSILQPVPAGVGGEASGPEQAAPEEESPPEAPPAE